jgi:hypothetical protein
MSETIRISRTPPERTSMHYATLRESGMALIRQMARETWTDHNVHDPGITLLEAFSYAMTELGLRIQLDVADLLRSGEVYAPRGLVPAHRVLPCAPVAPKDLRKLLLDHPLVSDAWITTQADSEVPFYEDPTSDPPFTYVPGTARVLLRGLFEVVLEFAAREGNSNTYTVHVNAGGHSYTLDMALPHWDEPEAVPFQEGATINAVLMLTDGIDVWRPLEEAQTYFGEIQVSYTGVSGTANIVLWVLLRITDTLAQPALVSPGILAAARSIVETTGPGSLVERFAQRVRAAYGTVQQLQRYLSTWRNLCEEPVRLVVARVQEIAIRARIEVTGSTDLERLLAEIFLAIDRLLSLPIRFYSLAEMRAKGKGVAQVFDGPLLRHGFLDTEEVDNLAGPAVLYTSDILRVIMRRRSVTGTDLVAQENPTGRDIVAVTDLALSNFVNNRPITIDAQDCLRLVEIARYRPRLSLAKSRIILVRNDAEVAYDAGRVDNLFLEMQQQEQATALPQNSSPIWPVPRGESLPVEDYYPFQNDLPRIYGVGEARLPDSVGTERQAATRQMQGYLLLFEQFLADLTAQLGHINRFFSADPEEQATYFTHALFDLPEVQKLLKRFPPGGDWAVFMANPANPYHLALQEAAESRHRFLDRRNRMLDHLLARQGEETVTWGQELHRWAQAQLTEAALPPTELPARMDLRRQAANARLIRAKAAFLRDAPELNANRLQAFGNPLQRQPELVRVERLATGYGWVLAPDEPVPGEALLRAVNGSVREAAAAITAEEAVVLAAQSAFYEVVTAPGGRRRYQLKDGLGATARVVAESPQTWETAPATQNALQAAVARFAAIRLASSLTPMERRIAHLTGIRSRARRRLIVPVVAFFEIFDEDDGAGTIEKRWRFWELPGYTGRELLHSVLRFPAPTAAEQSIGRVLQYGMDEWNYQVAPAGPHTYNFALQDPAGDQLGRPIAPVPSPQDAERAMAVTIDHLYLLYSAEGFHVVEHVLLRPRQNGDPFLSLPMHSTARERDPYSQRLSLIFPSGYARNFSDNTVPRMPVTPHRFRDLEFRRHAERMVQQACPAHLFPSIYWVDRQIPGTPDAPASFEQFEARYFQWLESLLIPGAALATVTSARAALIQSLNGIAHG